MREGRQGGAYVRVCITLEIERKKQKQKKGSSDGGKKDVYVCNLYIRVDFFLMLSRN